MGLRLAGSRSGRNARNDLQSYLGGFDSAQRARLVTRLGWHDKAFLLPEQQIGSHAEHLHFYEAGAQLPPISEAGSLEQWQQQIGALCVGNHRLAFVVSVAFAGPLLNLLGHESGALLNLDMPEQGENFGSWTFRELAERSHQHSLLDLLAA